jgi:5'(3')-deoxyribonucleotidase
VIWVNEYNRLKNAKIAKEDIIVWDIHKILPITETESESLFSNVWIYRWKDIPPTHENIGEIIQELKLENYRISILTKRERKTIPYVYNWLEANDIYYDELIGIFDSNPKSIYPFDILVDDAPHNIIDIKFPKKGILFNQPWNKNFDWPLRINSLSEIFQLLELQTKGN